MKRGRGRREPRIYFTEINERGRLRLILLRRPPYDEMVKKTCSFFMMVNVEKQIVSPQSTLELLLLEKY